MAEQWLSNGSLLVQVDSGDLSITGGQISMGGASRARATRGTAQSIPNVTWTTVLYKTETYDNLGEYDSAINCRFTAQKAGYYLVSWNTLSSSVAWDAAEIWLTALCKNNVIVSYGYRDVVHAAHTGYLASGGTDMIYLVADDYIDIQVYHNQGVAVDLYGNTDYNYFAVHRLS